jgi:hypothetical protein
VGVGVPVAEPGVLGVPMSVALDVGAVVLPFRFALRARVGGVARATAAFVALVPTASFRVTSGLEIEAFGVVNVASAGGSTLDGGPGSIGIGLHAPARGRHRHGQCHDDRDCAGGFACRIAPNCADCLGGPTYCVRRR